MAVRLGSRGNQQQFVDCRTDLSAGYHTYSMEYRQGSSIKFFFDDSNVYTTTRNVPVGPYFIIVSNSIASPHTASWHTQVSNLHAAHQPDARLSRARPSTVEPATRKERFR